MSEQTQREKTLQEALADAWIESVEDFVQRAKEIRRAYGQLPRKTRAEIELPNIDLHELEHDEVWRSWKKDEKGQCTFPVEEGKAGWIRIQNAGNTVLTLVKAMKTQNLKKVSLGLFEYKLSGEDFLQRRPLKKSEESSSDPHSRMEKNIQNIKEAGQKLLS